MISASKLCSESKPFVYVNGGKFICTKSGTETKLERKNSLSSAIASQIESVPDQQVVNQIGAASRIQTFPCPWEGNTQVSKYVCLAFRAPYAVFTFLFRPVPLLDTTSLRSSVGAIENVLWFVMILICALRFSTLVKSRLIGSLYPSLIFLVLYVVGAGSYEGNMGTAFRHKSLILWIVLLMLFAVLWRGQDEAKELQGNNSQESAV